MAYSLSVPKSVHEHMSNASYYLEAADRIPPPTNNAAHILLLLVAWENIIISDHELSAWANDIEVSSRIYKSHKTKLKNIPHTISGPKGIKFSTGDDFHRLRIICQYGYEKGNKDIRNLFRFGWHTDRFRNGLIGKIKWVDMMVNIYESPDFFKLGNVPLVRVVDSNTN